MSVLRSFLFCPANHERRLTKTRQVDADAVIVDLEDSVARSEKVSARASAVRYLKEPHQNFKAYVRVNDLHTPWSFGDFLSVVTSGIDGIVLPKAESATDMLVADTLISGLESERGLQPGSVDLMPIIETAAGIEALGEILRATTRVKRACFGSGDFTNDTNTTWSRDNTLCLYGRAQLVIMSRAARREPPIDTVWAHLDDRAGFEAEAEEGRKLGFAGKFCIHPDQIETVHRVFSPGEAEIAAAQKICTAFESAERDGVAAIVVDGSFVDYPVVQKAYQTLELVKQLRDTRRSTNSIVE